MKYRNTKTGAVIDVKSVISGGYWQAVEPADSSDEDNLSLESKRKTGRNKIWKI